MLIGEIVTILSEFDDEMSRKEKFGGISSKLDMEIHEKIGIVLEQAIESLFNWQF